MLNALEALIYEAVNALQTGRLSGLAVFFITLAIGLILGYMLRSGIVIEEVDEDEDDSEPIGLDDAHPVADIIIPAREVAGFIHACKDDDDSEEPQSIVE